LFICCLKLHMYKSVVLLMKCSSLSRFRPSFFRLQDLAQLFWYRNCYSWNRYCFSKFINPLSKWFVIRDFIFWLHEFKFLDNGAVGCESRCILVQADREHIQWELIIWLKNYCDSALLCIQADQWYAHNDELSKLQICASCNNLFHADFFNSNSNSSNGGLKLAASDK